MNAQPPHVGHPLRHDDVSAPRPACETAHERIGCGENRSSYSAFVFTLTADAAGGNSNYLVAKRFVTIDDVDLAGVRTLKLRKIQPIDLGSE